MAAPDFIGVPRDDAVLIDGTRDPSAMVSNRIKFDAKDSLVLFEPKAAPFTTLMTHMRDRRKATQYRFDVFQKGPLPRVATVNGAQTSGDTSIEVTTGQGTRFRADDLVLNGRTREVILVTAISTDTLTAVRQIGGSAAAPMSDLDELVILGAAREDGSSLGDLKSTKEEDVFNYCQIFDRGIGWTGRQVNTDYYGGRDKNTERRAQGIEFRKDIELAMFFSKRHTRTGSGGKLQTMMGGLEYWVDDAWDVNGQEPTENQFMEFLEWAMREGDGGSTHGSGVKYLFACDRMITIIERWARDRIQYVNPLGVDTGTSTSRMARKLNVGLRVGKFTTSHGDVMLVHSPIFRIGNPDRSILVDLNHVRWAYHQGRDVKLLENQENNSEDASKERWFADVSLEVTNKKAHTWITNIPV